MRRITYAIEKDTGIVWSRFYDWKAHQDMVALPVLEYDKMTPENGFRMSYRLEKFEAMSVLVGTHGTLKWTKKIPRPLKNRHRRFWGMPRLTSPTKHNYRKTGIV